MTDIGLVQGRFHRLFLLSVTKLSSSLLYENTSSSSAYLPVYISRFFVNISSEPVCFGQAPGCPGLNRHLGWSQAEDELLSFVTCCYTGRVALLVGDKKTTGDTIPS